MKSKNIVICDSETVYANRLAQWLLEKKEMNFQIHVMSKGYLAETFAKEQGIHILIVDDGIPKEVRAKLSADHTIFLYRYLSGEEEKGDIRRVFKYQPVTAIFDAILEICMQEEDPTCFRPAKKGKEHVFAVYSPVHCVDRTAVAWALANRCARSGRTLYFSTDAYTRLPDVEETDGFSVSDLVYFAGQESCRLGMKVSASAQKIGETEYLNPPVSREDMGGMGGQEWWQILSRILAEGVYEYLVIEPELIQTEFFLFLEKCERIFAPTLTGEKARWETECFLKDLRRTGYARLEEEIHWIHMEKDWKGELLEQFEKGGNHGKA